MQCIAIQAHFPHITPGLFHGLLDRNGHLTGFAQPIPDTAVAIANNCQSGEAEDTSTFDNFCYPTNRNQFLLKSVSGCILNVLISHFLILELQARFTRCLSNSLYTPVIFKP